MKGVKGFQGVVPGGRVKVSVPISFHDSFLDRAGSAPFIPLTPFHRCLPLPAVNAKPGSREATR